MSTNGNRYDAIVVGRTLRRVADRDAAGPQGLQGPGRRPGDLPERHALDPHRPPAGRGVAAPLGAARPGHGDRVPADPHLRGRLRPLHRLRGARHRRDPGRLRPPADRAGQAAGRRRGRGRGGGPGGVHRRRGPHRGRARHRRPRPRRERRHGHRARPGGRRGGRPALAGRPRGPARAVPREAAAPGRLLHLLERAADGGPLRDLGPPRPGLRGLADQRRPDGGHRRLAVRGVRGQQERHRGQLPQDAGAGPGVRRPRPRRHPRGALSSAPPS